MRTLGYYVDNTIPLIRELEYTHGSQLQHMRDEEAAWLAREIMTHCWHELPGTGELATSVEDFAAECKHLDYSNKVALLDALVQRLKNRLDLDD